jgi:tryptophan halogenase
VDTSGVFSLSSYEAILYGMDFLREECDRWFGTERPVSQVAKGIQDKLRAVPGSLPPHDLWLQRVIGMPVYPSSDSG